jgi:predicted amidohydrolase YtcJ
MAAAGVTAVVQPGFLWPSATTTPRSWAPSARRGCTGGRAFLDHGVRLAASSDRPVVDGAPLRAVQFMVERRSSGGAAIGPVVREGQPDPIQ